MSASRMGYFVVLGLALTSFTACEGKGGSEDSPSLKAPTRELLSAESGGVVGQAQSPSDLGPSVVPGILPPAEVNIRRRLALAGDHAAAFALNEHYNKVGNHAEAKIWVDIGAENGELNSMMLMAYKYEQESGIESCLRAIFWLARSRALLEEAARSPDQSENQKAFFRQQIEDVDEEMTGVKKKEAGC